jgi:hypothetical protein
VWRILYGVVISAQLYVEWISKQIRLCFVLIDTAKYSLDRLATCRWARKPLKHDTIRFDGCIGVPRAGFTLFIYIDISRYKYACFLQHSLGLARKKLCARKRVHVFVLEYDAPIWLLLCLAQIKTQRYSAHGHCTMVRLLPIMMVFLDTYMAIYLLLSVHEQYTHTHTQEDESTFGVAFHMHPNIWIDKNRTKKKRMECRWMEYEIYLKRLYVHVGYQSIYIYLELDR